jgi:hypothetical protein
MTSFLCASLTRSQIFSIFGASNPGLNAVPLIVIVVITAIKDAIEDYRRTILDNELNNSPVHRLLKAQQTGDSLLSLHTLNEHHSLPRAKIFK